jgi:anti-anti-sigma factor
VHNEPAISSAIQSGVTIRLLGEFDYANAGDISDAVSTALGQSPRWVLVDLDGVEFMSAAALGAVVRSRNSCRLRGARMTVRTDQARLRHLFTITGLDGLLEASGPRAGEAPQGLPDPSPVTYVGAHHHITVHAGTGADLSSAPLQDAV